LFGVAVVPGQMLKLYWNWQSADRCANQSSISFSTCGLHEPPAIASYVII